jgi:beta-lactamase superfamily II metal-dependent hydrolase
MGMWYQVFYCLIFNGVICGSLWGSTIEATLQVCFFHSGQGNCIALRADDAPHEPKLIFIDCGGGSVVKNGCKNNLLNPGKLSGRRLRELFEGVPKYGIFITHNHKDHDNLCETIMKVGNESGCAVPLFCKPISAEEFEEGDEALLREREDDFREILPERERSR